MAAQQRGRGRGMGRRRDPWEDDFAARDLEGGFGDVLAGVASSIPIIGPLIGAIGGAIGGGDDKGGGAEGGKGGGGGGGGIDPNLMALLASQGAAKSGGDMGPMTSLLTSLALGQTQKQPDPYAGLLAAQALGASKGGETAQLDSETKGLLTELAVKSRDQQAKDAVQTTAKDSADAVKGALAPEIAQIKGQLDQQQTFLEQQKQAAALQRQRRFERMVLDRLDAIARANNVWSEPRNY